MIAAHKHAKQLPVKLIIFTIVFILAVLSAGSTGLAVPGAETREDAFAELAARQAEGQELSEEELESLEAARAAEAVKAITAEGIAPIQAIWIYLFEDAGDDAEEPRTTITMTGAIDPYTPLPAKVMFYFAEDFQLNMLEQADFDTGESLGDLEYVSGPTAHEDFENLTTYTFELTEGHVFNAGLEISLPLFDTEAMPIGDSPMGSFSFVPPNDLYGLVVGFVAPSEDRVGVSAGEESTVLLGETEEGEIYGIVRENVPGDELQEYLIAFGSREARDAALAAATAEGSIEGTPTAVDNAVAWLSSPFGMIVAGSILVLAIAGTLIVVLWRRNNAVVNFDDDPHDENGDSGDEDDSDEELSET